MERCLVKSVVSLMAYLTGVGRQILSSHYEPEMPGFFAELDSVKEARIIRSLCKIRNSLLLWFRKTDDAILYDLKNLPSIPYYSADDISQLEDWGFTIVKANCRSIKYIMDVNQLITNNIDKCRELFPAWLEWNYIRELFIMPSGYKEEMVKREWTLMMNHLENYPYQVYLHWKPGEYGNIFYNDEKFLKILYTQHGRRFTEQNKVMDASPETKNTIYSFVADSLSVVMAVDCENSDVYKIYATLRGLGSENLQKIKKIILYDDVHTTNAWKLLERFTHLPVEYIEVERVTGNKSLVDIRMTAGICEEFYRNGVQSFILFSSDSDYWGLITSLPDARFLVMQEREKTGNSIREAMSANDIRYCCIDDFCQGHIDEFKTAALTEELRMLMKDALHLNAEQLCNDVYRRCRLEADEQERKRFCDRYIRTLRLSVNSDGDFTVEVPK